MLRAAIDFVKRWGRFIEIRQGLIICPLAFAFASMLLAARATRGWPGLKILFLVPISILFAHVCTISYGHIIRRQIEAKDPDIPKEYVVGEGISLTSARIRMALGAIGLCICGWLANPLCFYASPLAILAICFYQHTPRYTDFCSFYLGGIITLAPLGSWMAVQGNIHWEPLALGLISGAWISGLNTLYSIRTYAFDRAHGIHSLVTRWGVKNALSYAFFIHLITVMAMAVFGFFTLFKIAYMITIGFIALCVLIEHGIAKIRKTTWIDNAFFRLNIVVCSVYLTGVLCEVVFPFFNFQAMK